MESTNELALSLSGTRIARLLSAAKAALAVIGLAVVLAALLGFALPEPREALLRPLLSQLGGWTAPWDVQQGNVSAGTIQTGDAAEAREQRAVTDFIAKRYRVANDAVSGFVAGAYRAGTDWKVDPLLILAVMAVESRYNPVAESNVGAKGLMQVIPKFHQDKLQDVGGESSLLDPQTNIQVGAQILREYLRRFGETETALQMYAGAFDEPNSQYAFKVLAERARLEQVSRQAKQSKSA
jgi:soluble lytic murein transglycosylase-like protein